MSDFKKGDKIKIYQLETEVDEVVVEFGETMLRTKYGDFNADIVIKIIENENQTEK
jgi:hypothetical protein